MPCESLTCASSDNPKWQPPPHLHQSALDHRERRSPLLGAVIDDQRVRFVAILNLPSPRRYRGWLRDHLDERAPIPYLREKAAAPGSRLEGQTKADAMLLARDTGVAVIFEAKVLSDISTHVTFDVARNQLSRTIDVTLEANSKLRPPLSLRKPERTFLVLLTPALMQIERAGDAISKTARRGSR